MLSGIQKCLIKNKTITNDQNGIFLLIKSDNRKSLPKKKEKNSLHSSLTYEYKKDAKYH